MRRKIPMTKSQIQMKVQIPMTNADGPDVQERVWTLEIGHWDFIGIWDLVIGISRDGISTDGI
jgi:hypothetical protein